MKKCIVFTLIAFFTPLMLSASQLPLKAQEIMDKYNKMAQEDKNKFNQTDQDDTFHFPWNGHQAECLSTKRKDLNALNSWSFSAWKLYLSDNSAYNREKKYCENQITELVQKEKAHWHTVNVEKWQQRESDWKANQDSIQKLMRNIKIDENILEMHQRALDQTDKDISDLKKLDPSTTPNYQEKLSEAYDSKRACEERKGKSLSKLILFRYEEDKQLLSASAEILKKNTSLYASIQQELQCYNETKHAQAFVKSNIAKAQDRKLFYDYHNRTVNE